MALGQFLADDDRVDGAVLLVELDEDIVDDLMIRLEERVAIDDLDDVADHLLIEHHRCDQAHLRLDRVRREFLKLAGEGCINELAHPASIPNHRLLPTSTRKPYGQAIRCQAECTESVFQCVNETRGLSRL